MSPWPYQPISSLGTVITGSTPKTSEEHFYGGDIPFVTPAELDQTDPIMNAARTLSETGSQESRLLPEGTVMVCCIGSLGKVGIAGRTVASNQQINSVIFDPKIIWPRFGFYACRLLKSRLETLAPATTVPIVNKSKFGQLKIPVPPLEEQKRIADILDRAEALRAKRRAALDLLDELTQSIFIEMFGDPVINPMGWNTKKLKKLCVKILGGGTPSKSRPEYYEGNMPWVTPKDMKQDFIQDSIDHISAQAVKESSTKLIPPNSLLMVIRSGILKKKLPVAINTCEVTINQDMKGFLFDNRLTNSYFMLYFFKIYQRDLLNRVRSVTADNLEFDQIKDINVIVPPIEKQQKFALRVAAIGKLKTSHETSLSELNELFASLQYRAFRGEL
ncbi:MAG: restriction endonuclease subunit S [Methanosarcina sp.]|jgi:type I restriction enzyme S subunit